LGATFFLGFSYSDEESLSLDTTFLATFFLFWAEDLDVFLTAFFFGASSELSLSLESD